MKDQLLRIINHPRRTVVATGVASFAGGAVLGYILGKRRGRVWVEDEYGTYEVPRIAGHPIGHVDSVVETEEGLEIKGTIIDADAYEKLRDRDFDVDEIDPSVLSRADLMDFDQDQEQSETTPAAEEEVGEVIASNVFAGNDETWDYQAELAKRTESEPYIIHKDEFFEQQNDYTQTTLTYYEGDNQLVDEDDVPIYNRDRVVGEIKFGHGSGGDPNVFFVRNDKNRAEYEIIRHEGMFAVEVHGLDPNDLEPRTLKHSAERFHRDD